MDEARLLEKLRAIEALFAGATIDGKRVAAAEARKRIQLRLKVIEEADPPIEYKFRVADGATGAANTRGFASGSIMLGIFRDRPIQMFVGLNPSYQIHIVGDHPRLTHYLDRALGVGFGG